MRAGRRAGRGVALVAAVALVIAGCSFLTDDPSACRPVDVGGECFAPSDKGFVEHALTSARAWPQLNGLDIEAGAVIEGFDAVAAQPTWIVPLRSGGQIVAASRFLPFGDQVRLGEVTLYEPARDSFPVPRDGERLVLVSGYCGDPLPDECLFTNYGWRIEQARSFLRLEGAG